MQFAFPRGTSAIGVSATHVYYRYESWVYRMELETLKVQRFGDGPIYNVFIYANGDAGLNLGGCTTYYASDGSRLSGPRSQLFAKWDTHPDYFVCWSDGKGWRLHKETGRTRERFRRLMRDEVLRRRIETFL